MRKILPDSDSPASWLRPSCRRWLADLFGWSSVSQHLPPARSSTVDIGGGRRLHLRAGRCTGSHHRAGPRVALHRRRLGRAAREAGRSMIYRVIAYDRDRVRLLEPTRPRRSRTRDRITTPWNRTPRTFAICSTPCPSIAPRWWAGPTAAKSSRPSPSQSPERVTHLVLVGSVGPGWQSDASPVRLADSRPSSARASARRSSDWIGSIPPLSRKLTHDVLIGAFSGERDMPDRAGPITPALISRLPGTLRALVEGGATQSPPQPAPGTARRCRAW